MDLKEIVYEGGDWIDLAHNKHKSFTFIKLVINFLVSTPIILLHRHIFHFNTLNWTHGA
jgi:hypothetical protein